MKEQQLRQLTGNTVSASELSRLLLLRLHPLPALRTSFQGTELRIIVNYILNYEDT